MIVDVLVEVADESTIARYSVQDGIPRLMQKMASPQPQAFCTLGQSIFIVSHSGLVTRHYLENGEQRVENLPFRGIEEISSNGKHILLLENDGALLLIDEKCQVVKRTVCPVPVQGINLGRDGTVWIAGGENVLGGFQVFWSENFMDFHSIPWPASAVHLFGDSDGIVWTINSREEVWKLHRLGEGNMPGCKRDAGCRNCMLSSHRFAEQVALVDGAFLVLNKDKVLRGYASPDATTSMMEWPSVARFSVS